MMEQILKHFKKVEDKDKDGQLNYLFTKTLKTSKPSYINFERIMDFLNAFNKDIEDDKPAKTQK